MALKDLIISSFPQYCEKLASGKDVCFRPMVVSEEKSLLLAKQTQDKLSILKTLIGIISSCFNESNLKDYSICDLENAFLLLRAKSLGEIESFTIRCPETNEKVTLNVNLNTDIKIKKSKISAKIKLNGELILVLTPPTIQTLLKYPNYNTDSENIYEFISGCVKQIITKKEVIDCSDKSQEEIVDFIKNLTPKQFSLIVEYFDSLPTLHITPEYTTSDGVTRKVTIKGIFDFINFFFEHITLELFYRQNFQMKYYHHYSIEEIENMIPWERSVYLEQIRMHLKEETNRVNNTTEMSTYA